MVAVKKDIASQDLEDKVQQWWSDLQRERKCSSTNSIAKVVNKFSQQEQTYVSELISNHIKQSITHSIESKNTEEKIITCNAINGCFDNFLQAIEAANISFNDIVIFIDYCINECKNELLSGLPFKSSASKTLEILHYLSRILVLILKLKRSHKRKTNPSSIHINSNIKKILAELSYTVSNFLTMDEVLMDSKCNFVMSSLLIREILVKKKEKLIQFHNRFLSTIPSHVEEKMYKLNVFRFLLSSGILNTLSDIVIDAHSTSLYLKYFIQLCESYSSDTAIVLNISRSLLLLVKSECFKDYVLRRHSEDSLEINSLLTCIWMLLDHPIACVRNSAKDFCQLLAVHDRFRKTMRDSLSILSTEKRSYYITLAALANESGSRDLLEMNEALSRNLFRAVYDPTLVSHVINALENMIIKDALIERNFSEWCELWIVPLLTCLTTVPLVVAADIEKLLDIVFKKHPLAVFYVIKKWSEPRNDDELRCIITALKIYNRQGLKLTKNIEAIAEKGLKTCSSLDLQSEKWKGLISERLLLFCLHHNDDDIRVSAFSLIIQGLKSTEIYSDQDFELIQYFLVYNMNNQHPSTRQKILSLIKKMLLRFSDGLTVIKRQPKSCEMERNKNLLRYSKFHDWLVSFCFSNIFDGANFNRLNTVLSILLFYLDCKQIIKIDSSNAFTCWKKILIALRSSYEENKVMAVVLAKKLNISELVATNTEVIESLFLRSIELCGKMEPPNVLTGSYLIQILVECPAVAAVVAKYLSKGNEKDDVKLLCLQALVKRLKEQIGRAKKNLILAAVTGPMYGILFAARLIIEGVDFAEIEENSEVTSGASFDIKKDLIKKWIATINELIEHSFSMIHIVSCVVNSSSPEGHIPSDFQAAFDLLSDQNFELFSDNAVTKTEDDESKESSDDLCRQLMEGMTLDNSRQFQSFREDFKSLIKKFNAIYLSVSSSSTFSEKILRNLPVLLRDCTRMLAEINLLQSADMKCEDCSLQSSEYSSYLQCLLSMKEKLNELIKNKNIGDYSKPTAQVLLLCSWRSIKEACLFLGGLVSKLPLEKTVYSQILSEERVISIGLELRTLLCEIKHRGAFEQAYLGFIELADALWRCSQKNLNELPTKWLHEILDQLTWPYEKSKMRLCSTRRSAGLPFLVQAIIASELQYTTSAKLETLHVTMNSLLEILEGENESVLEPRIHSLNILRALFKHAVLGEHVAPYVSRALMAAIRGSRANAWSERNSSSLLFSSLVIRIFGVARNKDTLSKKNRMTSRTFFQRYPELFDFFLYEMKLVFHDDCYAHECYPQPNVFLILLILGRLYPPPMEGTADIDFSEFLPLIDVSRRNSTLKIRELGSKALVPFISLDKLNKELNLRFNALYFKDSDIDDNERHGILLQLKAILTEMFCNQLKLMKELIAESGYIWIENTKWILDENDLKGRRIPYLVKNSYIQMLHLIIWWCPTMRNFVAETLNKRELVESVAKPSHSEKSIPGYFVFLETFHFLRLDLAVHLWLASGNIELLVRSLVSMLESEVDEVQAIPLRFCLYLMADKTGESCQEELDILISAQMKDLSCVQEERIHDAVKFQIFSHPQMIECMLKYITSLLSNAEDRLLSVHKVNTRLWLSVMSTFLLENVILVSDLCKSWGDCSKSPILQLSSLSSIINFGDMDIAVSGFVLYSIIFFDNMDRNAEELTSDVISNFAKLLFSFSDRDSDVKQREAVSKIFNQYYYLLNHEIFKSDNRALSIWILPLRLMVDEDSSVRKKTMQLVSKFQSYLNKNNEPEEMLIKFEKMSVSQLTTVPLKAQESLIDCYINVMGKTNIMHLVVQMVLWSLSACSGTVNYESISGQNEIGVFEKGNPNPFCEELAFSNVICRKLEQLGKLIPLKDLLKKKLNSSHIESIRDFLPTVMFPVFPVNLEELIQAVSEFFSEFFSEEPEPHGRTITLLSVQIGELKKALEL